jgi:hypothetical protein
MTSTDERNHPDWKQVNSETPDIHQQRELVDRNLMKLLGPVPSACCWT